MRQSGSVITSLMFLWLVATTAWAAADRPLPTLSVYVPVRDGIRLALDVYQPSGSIHPRATVLFATRYGRTFQFSVGGSGHSYIELPLAPWGAQS